MNKEYFKNWARKNREKMRKQPKPDLTGQSQNCKECKKTKPFTDFGINTATKTGYNYACKECIKHRNQEQYFKHLWGLSLSELEQLKKKQKYKCACCKEKVDLVIDHHHKTGLVRGLLCNQCNQAIGKLKDNEQIVSNVLRYLKKHRDKALETTVGAKCLRPHRLSR
jgi:hypothetical protein